MFSLKEKLRIVFSVLIIISAVCFLTGLCMYGEWIKDIRLYNAGLVSEYHLNWSRIVNYEPAIYMMSGGSVFGLLNLILLAITTKNEKTR